jgi:hypothetical protein
MLAEPVAGAGAGAGGGAGVLADVRVLRGRCELCDDVGRRDGTEVVIVAVGAAELLLDSAGRETAVRAPRWLVLQPVTLAATRTAAIHARRRCTSP